jgi:hypothetical protein
MELNSLQDSRDFTDNNTVHRDRMDNTTKPQDLAPETKKSGVMAACSNSNISHGTLQHINVTWLHHVYQKGETKTIHPPETKRAHSQLFSRNGRTLNMIIYDTREGSVLT